MDYFKRLRQFLTEVWSELKKTTWPSRNEITGTTMVVIITVLICGFYLWVVDKVLEQGFRSIYRLFE